MKHSVFIVIIFVSLLSIISCGAEDKKTSFFFEKDGSTFCVKKGRLKRTAQVTFPEKIKYGTASENDNFSLLFVLHGANTTVEEIKQITDFDSIAPDLDFIVVYPEGISNRWDSVSDNDFFNDMILYLSEKYNAKNVYLTGFSAGSIKVFELLEVLQDKITAIAPVSGLLKNDENINNLCPVDILHIHSKDDTSAPLAGAPEEGFMSVIDEINIFKEVSQKQNANKDVELFLYENQGHVWNKKNTELITDFFYNHPKKNAKIKIQLASQTFIYSAGAKINATAIVEGAEKIKNVKIYSNSTLLYETEKINKQIQFEFKNQTQGLFYLKAEAKLDDGTIIYSTLNPYYINIQNLNNDNLSLNLVEIKKAECESIENSLLSVENCIDKKLHTRWSSDWYDNQNVVFELAQRSEISKMVLFWEMANGKKYDVYCSDDGKEWKKVFEQKDGIGGIEIVDFEKTECNFIKIHLIQRATQYGFSLWEVFVLN